MTTDIKRQAAELVRVGNIDGLDRLAADAAALLATMTARITWSQSRMAKIKLQQEKIHSLEQAKIDSMLKQRGELSTDVAELQKVIADAKAADVKARVEPSKVDVHPAKPKAKPAPQKPQKPAEAKKK